MKVTLGLMLGFLVATAAHAGGMDGGGGQGVLCEPAGGPRTLRSLDLYEAETIWGYKLPAAATRREEFFRVLPNYRRYLDVYPTYGQIGAPPPLTEPQMDEQYRSLYVNDFESRLQSIPAGSRLRLSPDSGRPILDPPPACRIVQVLYYVDEDFEHGKILVDQDYWQLLSAQDQLAFAFHESIYKWLRGFGTKDSVATRKVVGLLFRNEPYPSVLQATYGQEHLRFCYASAPGTHSRGIGFFLVPYWVQVSPQEKMRFARLVFTSLGEEPVLTETTFDSIWKYDPWIEGKPFDTSGYIAWSRSALGSKRMALTFTDTQCIQKKRECIPKLEVQDDSGNWWGGTLSCRDFR